MYTSAAGLQQRASLSWEVSVGTAPAPEAQEVLWQEQGLGEGGRPAACSCHMGADHGAAFCVHQQGARERHVDCKK